MKLVSRTLAVLAAVALVTLSSCKVAGDPAETTDTTDAVSQDIPSDDDLSRATYAWSSSAQYGSKTISPYTFYTNQWGMVSGSSQTMYVNSAKDWYITTYQPWSTGGIKSYPDVSITVANIAVSKLTAKSTISTTTPSSGIWDQAHDVWVKGSSQNCNNASTVNYEIMLWTNWIDGKMWPISDSYAYSGTYAAWVPSPVVSSVTVGGRSWKLYVGNNGSNAVYSFLATSKTNNATIDVAAILKWLQANTNPSDFTSAAFASANGWKDIYVADKGKAYLPSNAYLYQSQFGWEIVSTTATASSSATPATLTFKTKAYSHTAY